MYGSALMLTIAALVAGRVTSTLNRSYPDSAVIGASETKRGAALKREDEARLVRNLAEKLAEIGARENSKVLLYAEAGPGWAGGSIFFARPDAIVWNSPGEAGLSRTLRNLWSAAPAGQKWRGVTMIVEGDSFRTEFDYGESWKADEDEGDRREPIVRAYFGDKPIYYPPLEGAEPWPED